MKLETCELVYALSTKLYERGGVQVISLIVMVSFVVFYVFGSNHISSYPLFTNKFLYLEKRQRICIYA